MIEYYPLEKLYENKDVKKEEVLKMMEWLELQPHLPSLKENEMIIVFHSCYFNQEATKRCLNNFFTARTHMTELFGNYDVTYKDHAACMNTIVITPFEDLSPRGNRVMYARAVDLRPEVFNFNSAVTLFDMRALLGVLKNPLPEGLEVVLDLYGGTISHLLRINLMVLWKVLYYVQEAIPVRLKGIHFVNPPLFMDKIYNLIKTRLKKDLLDMIIIHSNLESVHKTFTKDILPLELEGNAKSVSYYHEKMKEMLLENNELLMELQGRFKVDETKRPGKPTDFNEMFGVEGTFKKLELD